MVSPIYIFIVALGVGFLLSLFDKINREVSVWALKIALAFMTFVSGAWLIAIISGAKGVEVLTAGFPPPFSINLLFGLNEAFFTLFINLIALLGAFYLSKRFRENSIYFAVLYLMMVMGINGMIMTRDLFNLFVFMEISSIATVSAIGVDRNSKVLSAGFKYLIASGIASTLFLIGTSYIYRLTGTLNIDMIPTVDALYAGKAGFVAIFLVFSAIIIELKPWPANGWALDVYETVDNGIVSLIAVGNSGAFLFALFKLMSILPIDYYTGIAAIGVITLIFSNLVGIKQTNVKRLLGYSSIAQVGLIITAMALIMKFQGTFKLLGYVVGGLFMSHLFAKAGLFWLTGIIQKNDVKDWTGIRKNPVLILLFGTFIFTLVGLPPFPSFFAKWNLILYVFKNSMGIWAWLILLGSLLEAVYLFRWFGLALKSEETTESKIKIEFHQIFPVLLVALLAYLSGWFCSQFTAGAETLNFIPIVFAAALFVVDFLPSRIKGVLTLVAIGIYAYFTLPNITGIPFYFDVLFLLGGAIILVGSLYKSGKRIGFYPLIILMFAGLTGIAESNNLLQFFFSWELMTVGSYLLILRGKNSMGHALSYILFSLAAAYFILIGFGHAFADAGMKEINLRILSYSASAIPFLAIGFLIKTGAIGVHLWLPGSYSESEDDFSAIISSVLSKAGIFGLMMFMFFAAKLSIFSVSFPYVIGWLGALTAFFGTLMAVFQEDIKKLLAYSSMGQIGYIVLSVAILSHLGWISALYLTLNHFLFKGLLFLAIAGVVYRTKTRLMYQMGGLIKRMPFSFISVLIGIIALSGVPPLSGFGGKWLLYTSLMEKGWYLLAGLAMFTSGIAFLYCYRLIHAIFLGQAKGKFKNIKEAPLIILIPQYILIIAIMTISMMPKLIITPFAGAVSPFFESTLGQMQRRTLESSLGYWNGYAVMMVTMILFATVLVYLILQLRKKTQKIGQFNIVFAAERPFTPETTHYAYNFFNHYDKALGFLAKPIATRFWTYITQGVAAIASAFRHIYTGNGQTYALHIILYVVVLYFIMR